MDPTSIAPVRAVLDGLSQLVVGLADRIHPLAGASATGVAVILLTLGVRALLVPVGVAQVRAEIQRRRIAPALAELRRRHAGKPEQLSRATQELYAREGASPRAGCLPTLAQAPVLAAVYALFAHARIGGEANALLAAPFAGIPLGSSALSAAAMGGTPLVVSVVVLGLLAIVIEVRRRADLRFQGPPAPVDPALPGMAGMTAMMRVCRSSRSSSPGSPRAPRPGTCCRAPRGRSSSARRCGASSAARHPGGRPPHDPAGRPAAPRLRGSRHTEPGAAMTSTTAGAVALPPTRVTYPAGSVASEGQVLRVDDLADGTLAVVLDATACHPVDAAWPDQPADRAVLRVRGAGIEVLDCVVGAASTDPAEDATLHVGADVPGKKGADGWSFVAVHVVAGDAAVRVGEAVEVAVDPEHRRALRGGPTGCHLASLALDRALADAWTKDVPTDALGAPGFDALAIATSRIGPWSSVDTYRLGQSRRTKGFVPAALVERLDEVRDAVDATLAEWVASGAAARIEREGDLLTSRRSWVCELPGGAARIPCGGTHLAGVVELASITIDLEVEEADGAVVVRMRTTCVPA